MPVRRMSGMPSRLIVGSTASTSSVSPELESAITTSPRATMPMSPCTPSAGWRKYAGVPVLASVAAIFRPTSPDLPMPVTITRPAQPCISSTAMMKRSSRREQSSRMPAASSRSTRSASPSTLSRSISDSRRATDPQHGVEQRRQIVQLQHVGTVGERPPVGEGAVGIFVDLHEEGVDPHRHRRPRQRLHVLSLAARPGALTTGKLHRVGCVEHHGVAEGAHDRQAPEIDDQVVVAEARAALGEQEVLTAGGSDLLHHVL